MSSDQKDLLELVVEKLYDKFQGGEIESRGDFLAEAESLIEAHIHDWALDAWEKFIWDCNLAVCEDCDTIIRGDDVCSPAGDDELAEALDRATKAGKTLENTNDPANFAEVLCKDCAEAYKRDYGKNFEK